MKLLPYTGANARSFCATENSQPAQIDMPDEDKRKILWDNCAYYYGMK
jgi:hypothetical protein